jgi:GrpB-like predicted nucleotidyltransferase (UPF0157 family)
VQRHPSLDDRHDPAIRIVDHDPEWPAQADAEIRRIKEELGEIAVRVDHVGSTAVPQLAAKPIIDLQLSVASIDPVESYREPLARLGYLFVPEPESPDFHLFTKPAERPRTHHLHVCESGGEHERRHLAVRDFLRANPGAAAEYEALKRKLAAEHPEDRLAYIEGKETFMATLEARALPPCDTRSLRGQTLTPRFGRAEG